MKKSILITAAAVAVILAVILTAGCVGDSTQQQTTDKGTLWMYTDDTGSVVRFITLSDDGTGTFHAYKAEIAENGDVEYKVSIEHGFTWTKDADKTVKTVSADGTEMTFTIDEVFGLLTSQSGKVYQKIPRDTSGSMRLEAYPGLSEDKTPNVVEAIRLLIESFIASPNVP